MLNVKLHQGRKLMDNSDRSALPVLNIIILMFVLAAAFPGYVLVKVHTLNIFTIFSFLFPIAIAVGLFFRINLFRQVAIIVLFIRILGGIGVLVQFQFFPDPSLAQLLQPKDKIWLWVWAITKMAIEILMVVYLLGSVKIKTAFEKKASESSAI